MILIRDNFRKISKPCVATIGNFDGLHLGHQQIIEQVVKKANELNLVPTVMTFEPLPQRVLRPHQDLLRLTSLRQKLTLLGALGIQQVVCLRFNHDFASLTPDHFIEKYLVQFLKVQYLIIGEDFRFGAKQQGNILMLQERARQLDFVVQTIPISINQSEKISSTLIREALIQGDLAKVKTLLGRNFKLTERVQLGAQRGRLLGFCTANLPMKDKHGLFKGVFVTKTTVDQKTYLSVTNVGRRPTVDGQSYLTETHLLDFSDNIYSKRITVEFIHKLRDEKKFSDIDALKRQIADDIVQTKQFIKKTMTLRYPEYEQSGI